jgi:hypothetical protein
MAEVVPARTDSGITVVFAVNVMKQLERLGFECSTQQVAAWLKRISHKDLPPVERDSEGFWAGAWGYRVTQWGRNELWNRGFTDLGKLDPVSAQPQSEGTK